MTLGEELQKLATRTPPLPAKRGSTKSRELFVNDLCSVRNVGAKEWIALLAERGEKLDEYCLFCAGQLRVAIRIALFLFLEVVPLVVVRRARDAEASRSAFKRCPFCASELTQLNSLTFRALTLWTRVIGLVTV